VREPDARLTSFLFFFPRFSAVYCSLIHFPHRMESKPLFIVTLYIVRFHCHNSSWLLLLPCERVCLCVCVCRHQHHLTVSIFFSFRSFFSFSGLCRFFLWRFFSTGGGANDQHRPLFFHSALGSVLCCEVSSQTLLSCCLSEQTKY
jgi:hypothetical protein